MVIGLKVDLEVSSEEGEVEDLGLWVRGRWGAGGEGERFVDCEGGGRPKAMVGIDWAERGGR